MAKTRLLPLVALGVVIVVVLFYGNTMLSLIPGYEGLHAGVEGATIGSNFYKLGVTLPTSGNQYAWKKATSSDTMLSGKSWLWDWGTVRVEVGDPRSYSDPWSQGKTVDYWVKENGVYVHIKGEIVTYEVPMTISAVDEGGFTQYTFDGEKIWVGLGSVAWNRAVQEQSAYSGNYCMGTAWETPMQAVITAYSVVDGGEHHGLDPSVQGRSVTLYTGTAESGTISDLISSGNVNATLAGDPSPDTRLRQIVYFPVTLTNFGVSSYGLSQSAPVVDYTLKVYALRIGKWTYTNIDDTLWGNRDPDNTFFENFVSWVSTSIQSGLASPYFWVILILVIVAVVILFAIRNPGIVMILAGMRKK